MNPNLQIPGFQFSGISAGIKKKGNPDLALIYCERPATVVGGFTSNLVKAAPVVLSQKNVRSGLCRAVIVNSGNANACTGAQGLKDARAMVQATARSLGIPEKQVLVCSTGKIGIPMPMSRILKKIPQAVKALSPEHLVKSAEAILTTDQSVKIASAEGSLHGKPYRIVGFAKGAGMIEPHLEMAKGHATMLAFMLTDAFVPRDILQALFRNCMEETFNRVTVDGDTSTNDTALLLANGAAGNRPFSLKTPPCRDFGENLFSVMDSLARQMVKDGEGATKCVKVEVVGAKNAEEARKMAYTVANSYLVKTAFFGEDPNWGRILGALGRSGATLKPDRVDIYYDAVCVVRRGVSTGPAQERAAKKVMQKSDFTVKIDVNSGRGSFGVYASDLTLDYVKLNSHYRT